MGNPRLRILCGEPENYSKLGLNVLGEFADFDARTLTQAAFEKEVPEYDVLFVRLRLRVGENLLSSGGRLKAVVSPTTGVDHIAIKAAKEHDVQVFTLRGEREFLKTITSTAEHTFALLLALMRNLPAAVNSVKKGNWDQKPFQGHELAGKTLGLIGYGRLGEIVAGYAHAFGMKVAMYDPFVDHVAPYVQWCKTMDEVLCQSHIVTVHVPLNEKTIGLIGSKEIGMLPVGAFLVNTARGAVVEENSLLSALESGHLAGVAIDVLTNEDKIVNEGHPLIKYAQQNSNLLITPHIGGAAVEAIERTDLFVIESLKKWWENGGQPCGI